jgi:hypothetical protein
VRKSKHSKSRCAGRYCKGNAIAKELMPSWMNYAHLYFREGILGGIEKRESQLTGISS